MTKKRTGREREDRLRAIGDLTGSKRAERALRELEEQWRSLVENIPDIVMTVDADGTILFINRTVLGFTAERVIGTSVYDYVPREHHDTLRKFLEGAFETGEAHDFEIAGAGPFGRTSWYFNRIGPVVRDGRVVAATLIATDITERKLAEEALRESEERWRSLAENAPGFIIRVDGDGKIRFINRGVPGISAEDALGESVYEYIEPDYRNTAREIIKRVLETGEPSSYEVRGIGPDGHHFAWYETQVGPIKHDGQIVAVTLITTDITARKQAEEALREAEGRFRSLVEASPDAITLTDLNTNIIMANDQTAKLHGYDSPEDIIGRSAFDLIAPENRERAVENAQKTLETGTVRNVEYTLLRKDGTRFPAELSASLIVDAAGNPVAFTAVTRDITERKEVEGALRESEERYRDLVENLNDAIYELDAGGRITYISPVIEETSGYSPSEMVGRPFTELLHPDDVSAALEDFQRSVSGDHHPAEHRFVSKAGEVLWVRSFGRPILDRDRVVGLRGVLTDITEHKLADEALRESEERYRDLVELSPYAMAVHGEEKMVFVNSAGVQLFGAAAPHEIIGRPIWDFVHPDHVKAARRRIQGARTKGKKVDLVEEKLVRLDGQVIVVEMAAIPITYQGKPARQLVLRDITERRQMEEALRESEDRYRTLVEAAPDVIYALSTDGTITSLNSAFESASGWSRDEWLGKHFARIIHPDDLPAAMEDFRLVMQGDVPPVGEYRMLAKSGQYFIGETMPRPLIVDGKVVGTFGIARDITDRRRAEEALQNARDELESRVERQMQRGTSYGLTFRELTVLHLMADGRSDREIGTVLGISTLTAHKHAENIRAKMAASSRTEASVRAVREGLLD